MLTILKGWNKLGHLVNDDGDQFWGTEIDDPKLRHTHSVFAPIDCAPFAPVAIHGLEIDDHPYAQVLNSINGVKLFRGDFSLYGLHLSAVPVTKIFMPFSLLDENINYRALCIRHEALLIGGYRYEGKEFHMLQQKSGSIVEVEKSTLEAIVIDLPIEQYLSERLSRIARSEKWVRTYSELAAKV
ncbi:hypothetical protein SAMN04488030_1852 [Aliiroseovarius halocynthiae]|uniref:Uncharacterized protein n=1 Tax=Aliiroseovarius halocynthiae TaxID=985055 RepID=A0A545SR01_9RHOB|nr:hypothetical protein [Aliiroseovarius halocynthiae]TQV67384.1 hypothetical protein FIL88_09135 [Aliiroseovarius halocynthiae]SMR81325.1 hypothetical protein SAMN04488030_1852 [Aliiroseovarius halocynthiae]